MKKKETQEMSLTKKIIIISCILFSLFIFSSCAAVLVQLNDVEDLTGNVAIIPIHGTIMAVGDSNSNVITADDIVALLREANDDATIDAVILDINSGGGSPVGSDEIGRALQDMDKPVVSVIREVGASGAYWVATNTDHIVANRMAVTGSIGVIGSYFGFEEFMDDHNITYRRFVSGEKKDIGSPFRDMTREEQVFLQDKMESIHWYFIDEVARNRNMTFDEVKVLATGEYYLGFEAKKNGLIDETGGYKEAKAYLEAQGIKVKLFTMDVPTNFWDDLFGIEVTFPQNSVESAIRT